ncbi:MAG: SPFH domain-containing protein [Candidatus Nanopelagicales bacterium]
MDNGSIISAAFAAIILVLAIITVAKAVRIVSQANAGIVERLGRYHRTLTPGLALVMPFIDRVLPLIDMREQVQPFQPQPVITSDNLVVNIDTVVYYQVTDPKAASYEIQNPIAAIEQITVTTLRNVIGSLDLEQTLTSRDHINSQLRATLDEATTKWGIRVNRVELKSIDPPPSVVEAMEKQMKAERDKRATILTAEGYRQSQILEAEGEKQSAILRAEGQKQSAILEAEGEATAIATVTTAVHTSDVDQRVLAYQYLQQLPTIANGTASKLWVLPAELTDAMRLVADGFSTPRRD